MATVLMVKALEPRELRHPGTLSQGRQIHEQALSSPSSCPLPSLTLVLAPCTIKGRVKSAAELGRTSWLQDKPFSSSGEHMQISQQAVCNNFPVT